MKKKRRLPSNDWLFGVCSTNLGRGLNPIPSWHCGCSERVDYVDFWHSTFFFHDCQPVALPLDYLQRPKKKYSNCHQNLIHFFSFLSTALPRHVLSLCERPTGSRVTDCTSVPRRTGFLRSTRMNRGAAVHFCSDCVSSSPHGDSSTTASSWLVPTDWLQTTELTDHWILRGFFFPHCPCYKTRHEWLVFNTDNGPMRAVSVYKPTEQQLRPAERGGVK